MNHRPVPAILLCAALLSCNQAPGNGDGGTAATEAPVTKLEKFAEGADRAAVPLPQIAYSYDYGFRLSPAAVVTAQEAHLRLCDELGPTRCQIAQMQREAAKEDHVRGSLTLMVAAPIARQFGDRLIATATKAGGETVDRRITAEDLSKQIVDTDARIRTKETLVNRLTTLLETRSGNIAQAVEAERAVNNALEELEQARAEVAAMRGRIALSTIKVDYESSGRLGGGFIDPMRSSFAAMGSFFGQSISVLLTLIAVLLPWALLGGLGWLAINRLRARMQRYKGDLNERVQSESEAKASE